MRRAYALLAVPLIAAAAVAGCGSPHSAAPAGKPASASADVRVTGAFGTEPKVSIPAQKAGSSLYVKTLIHGTGQPLTKSESLVGNFALYDWSGKTSKLLGSTYTSGAPTLFAGQMLPGLETALIGQKAGSRVLAVVPPKDGFGTSGNSQIGVKGTDTLVYVVDLIQEFGNTQGASGTHVSNGGGSLPTVTAAAPGKAPTVKIPSSSPPKSLAVKTLIKGKGAKVAKGQYMVVQYTGVIWNTGKVFSSSWSASSPFGFTVGAGQVVKGWDDGLVGQTVGSRVMLVVPPADAYGKSGVNSGGVKISGTDTLVFVVDILGSLNAK